jgi:hypothetical protein
MATDADEAEAHMLGFGLAGLILSIHALGLSVKRGDLTPQQALEVLTRARAALKSDAAFPGDPRVLKYARQALGLAERTIHAAAAEEPSAGPN